ncbi:hypothetical protein N657DRAFT_646890 [Parathielavia appendiculata]|uniref:Uncharacterized protein n=1 Tax=Parathielavia appendiculata TaxID=2587402 RepID=A0AAN6TX03_9PEZI|nr:hypothetical protein N657DRAFT_646890 [Parathielavia appendiculata]
MRRYIDESAQQTPGQAVQESFSSSFLPTLINLATSLQRLTLMFDDNMAKSRADQEVLITAFSDFAWTTRLPCLQLLDLRSATIRYADLLQLWWRVHRTATEIHLRAIALVDGAWHQFFGHLQQAYGRQMVMAGGHFDVTSSLREVRIRFSWLVEKSLKDDGGIQGNFRFQPTGVVVSDDQMLESCWKKCLRPMSLDCHRRFCDHVSICTTLVLGEEAEAGTSKGLKTLLDSTVVTTDKRVELLGQLLLTLFTGQP